VILAHQILSVFLSILNYVLEGELIIKSSFVAKGYLQYDSSSFTIEGDGTISFRTGDIYGYVGEERFAWRGRKEDYIQVCFTNLVHSFQSNRDL